MSTTRAPTKLTVLISGSGTNLQALIDGTAAGALPDTQIIRVISNKKTAYGLQRAERAGIPTTYHNLLAGRYVTKQTRDAGEEAVRLGRENYDADLAAQVLEDKPDLVVCAGWMHILAPTFLAPLDKAGVPCINLHPALPGRYDGIDAIGRAYADFQAGKLQDGETGVMIHYVISEVDAGEPIITEKVKGKEGESLDELESRMHEVEHGAIVKGTAMAIERLWEERGNTKS